MDLVNFLSFCESFDERALQVKLEDVDRWNKMFGVPRSHLKEAILNLRTIKRNCLFYDGFWNALKVEGDIIKKTLNGEAFLKYFQKSDVVQKEIENEEFVVFVHCKWEMIKQNLGYEKRSDIYVFAQKSELYFTEYPNIAYCELKNFYGISQVIYLILPLLKSKRIKMYYKDQLYFYEESEKLSQIAGMELFWSDFYQERFLTCFTDIRVNSERNTECFDKADQDVFFDQLIFLKLSGIKKRREEKVFKKKKRTVAFHRYKDYGDVKYLNYPHQWVGEHFSEAALYVREHAQEYEVNAVCSSEKSMDEIDVVIFWEFPQCEDPILMQALVRGKKIILFATESVGIIEGNEFPINAILFDKIATWRKNVLANQKLSYIPPVYFEKIGKTTQIPFQDRKEIVMVASIYEKYKVPYSLYKERKKFVLWMEKEHPGRLEFYGKKTKSTCNHFKCYRGPVKDKIAVLKNYRYCLCYENNYGYSQYVTEKIYDCLFARCVPIYLGAPDIVHFVPADCFIDMRKFHNFEELYQFIEQMDEKSWNHYIEKMERFLDSDALERYNGKNMLLDIKQMIT